MTRLGYIYRKNKDLIDKILTLIVFFLAVFLFFNYLFIYTAPFVIGFLISVLAERPVAFLKRKFRINRGIGALIFILALLAIISFFGYQLIDTAITQGVSFVSHVPEYSREISNTVDEWMSRFQTISELIPDELVNLSDSLFSSFSTGVTDLLGSWLKTGSGNVASALPNAFMYFLLIVLSSFFFIKDKVLIYETMSKVTPQGVAQKYVAIREGLFDAIIGYIKSQLIIMSVVSAIIILGLTIMRHPYSVFVGILIAFVDALPIFGSGAVFWPWAAISLISGDIPYTIGLMAIYGVVFITRQLMEPKVLSTQIGIHPLLTLSSMFAGLKLFGVLGFFIGPMTVVVTKIILKMDMEAIRAKSVEEETGGSIADGTDDTGPKTD